MTSSANQSDGVKSVISVQVMSARGMGCRTLCPLFTILLLFATWNCVHMLDSGMLFPRESSSREIREINGLWNFRADFSLNRNLGFEQAWFKSRMAEVNIKQLG